MNCAFTITLNRNSLIITTLLGILLLCYFLYGTLIEYNSSTNSKRDVDMIDLLSASIDAAKRGGVKVFKVRESASLAEASKGQTREGANDPVTDGDMLSHIEMFHTLRRAFPYVTIISEEKSSHKYNDDVVRTADLNVKELQNVDVDSEYIDSKDVQIWIDPLDATQEYTEDLRQYVTTMVCVAVKGVPTIGVIHKPFENFTAWAYVNHIHSPELLVVRSNMPPMSNGPAKIIVSRSHKGAVVDLAKEAFGSNAIITDAGGAGYKTLEVLSGRQDVYVHKTLIKKWDICAGNAIINHFGGKMVTLRGASIDYSSTSSYENPNGLLATLEHHQFYLKKFYNLQ